MRHRWSRRRSPRGLLISQHLGLWTLPGAAGTFARSPRLLPGAPLPAPSPASPSSPPSSSSAPPPCASSPLPSRGVQLGPAGWARGGRGRGRSRWRARAGAPHSGEAPRTALLRAQRGGGPGLRGAGTAAWPLPSLPSPKLRSPPGPDGLMIQRILLGRPGRGAGAGAEQLGQRAGAETGARAGIRAATEAAAAPRARRPLPLGGGSRCMGPGGRPSCAERRRRTPQAGWG